MKTELIKCPIVISSCDAYADAWLPFFTLLFRYWPSCQCPIYLITNHLKYPNNRIETLQCGTDEKWASNIRKALTKISSKYFIYLQEDYFLNRAVDNQRILFLLQLVENLKYACCRLYPSPGPDINIPCLDAIEVGGISKEAPYRVSLQAAIWNKNTFCDLLVDGETGWDMELNGTIRSRSIEAPFMSVKGFQKNGELRNEMFSYIHRTAIYKGRWTREAVELCRREGLKLDFNRRQIEPHTTLTTYLQRLYSKAKTLG